MANVLIGYSACPLTRVAFEAHGHNVWTCDLLPARDGSPKHFQCDIWEVALKYDWDFGLFHPMCTVLTCSGAWAFPDPDYKRWPGVGYHQEVKPETLTGKARRDQRVIELDNFRNLLALPYPKIIENPSTSFVNTAIRKPDQVIHPHQFGDDASKGTGLWVEGVPLLMATKYVEPRLVCENKHKFAYGLSRCPNCGSERYLPRWANQTNSGQFKEPPSHTRWLDRSATYPGIAAALGDQIGRYLCKH